MSTNLQPIDAISLARVSLLHPLIREEVKQLLAELYMQQVTIRIVQGLRTFKEQEDIYALGRTAPGNIVTWAQPGSSFHNYGLAFDFCLLHPDKTISWKRDEDFSEDHLPDWMQVVDLFKASGYVWGGDFPSPRKDYPHLQKKLGYMVFDLKRLWDQKKFDAKGYLVL